MKDTTLEKWSKVIADQEQTVEKSTEEIRSRKAELTKILENKTGEQELAMTRGNLDSYKAIENEIEQIKKDVEFYDKAIERVRSSNCITSELASKGMDELMSYANSCYTEIEKKYFPTLEESAKKYIEFTEKLEEIGAVMNQLANMGNIKSVHANYVLDHSVKRSLFVELMKSYKSTIAWFGSFDD